MGITFFIVMALLALTLFWVTYIADGKNNAGVHVICGALIGVVMGMYTMYSVENSIPKAIDVYRNKTELEVNYTIKNNDTISVDSLVVFKNIK
jgi:hypothetical protein